MTDSLALMVKAALAVEKVFSYLAGLAVVAASTAMAPNAAGKARSKDPSNMSSGFSAQARPIFLPLTGARATCATARNDALIVFLWLPVADPSVDLRFAIMLITPVSAFPRHKKTGSNKGRPVRIHTDIHFGSRCNHLRSRSRLCRLNLSDKQPLSVVWQIRYLVQLSLKKCVLCARN